MWWPVVFMSFCYVLTSLILRISLLLLSKKTLKQLQILEIVPQVSNSQIIPQLNYVKFLSVPFLPQSHYLFAYYYISSGRVYFYKWGEGETIKCGVSSNLLALYFLKRKEDDELEKKLNVDSSQMKSFWACLF